MDDFFDCALTVDVYNIRRDAQFTGLGLERQFATLRLDLARPLAALRVGALRTGERRGAKGSLDDAHRLMMRIGVLLGFVTAAAGFRIRKKHVKTSHHTKF